MKRITTLTAILFFAFYCKGQNIDSLVNLLSKTGDDSNKVNIYSSISSKLQFKNPKLSLLYSDSTITLSKKIKWRKGEAIAYKDMGNAYKNLSNFANAEKYFQKCLSVSDSIAEKNISARALGSLGTVYLNKSDYFTANLYNQRALSIFEELKDTQALALINSNIGVVYKFISDYPKAIEYYHIGYKYSIASGNKRQALISQNNIGDIHKLNGDHDKALQLFQKTLESCIEDELIDLKAVALTNIGNIYENDSNYTKALENHQQVLLISQQIDKKEGVLVSLTNIGSVYSNSRDYSQALKYFQKSLEIAISIDNKRYEAKLKNNLGHTSQRMGKYQEAIDYSKDALQISKDIGVKELQRDSWQLLSTSYEKIKNYDLALNAYKQYIILNDSIIDVEKQKEITRRQAKFEFDIKEAAVKAEHNKQVAVAAEKARLKLISWLITGIAIIGIGFLAFYFYRKREKYRFNQKITEVKQEALNAQMSDHFVGNTMSSINDFIENNEKEKASEYLLMFSRLIRKVLENSFKKSITLKDDLGILEDYIKLEKLQFTESQLQFDVSIDKGIDPSTTLIPPMIFQVLVENSIKHAFTKQQGGLLTLKVEKKGSSIKCIVEDNGIGRNAVMKLEGSTEKISLGTEIAQKLVQICNEQQGKSSFNIVDLFDEANNPKGTRVEFTIPFLSAA